MPKLSRRRFLGTGVGVAAATGIGYLTKDYWNPLLSNLHRTGPTPAATTTIPENKPPHASFELKRPIYIKPCVGQEIQFLNKSTDPDGDPMTFKWYVDGKLESESKDFSRLVEPDLHTVKLEVSDGRLADQEEVGIDFEPEQLPQYPQKTLSVKYKGINYYVASVPGWVYYTPSKERIEEELETIRNELGCNAIVITGNGNAEDYLIESTRLAVEEGFERVYIHPRYVNESIDVTLEKLVKFAPKVKSLREESPKVVYMFGREFSLEQSGIVRGGDWFGRLRNIAEDWNRIQTMLRPYMWKVISALKDSYGYELAYASGNWEAELVPWDNPSFESVMTDAYIQDYWNQTEEWTTNLLNKLKRYEKPVHSTEWGCYAFPGASRYGGGATAVSNPGLQTTDQNEQAAYIIKYLNMLNKARIDGCFYVSYDEPYPQSMGLIHGRSRRLGFYAYKSYRRTGS